MPSSRTTEKNLRDWKRSEEISVPGVFLSQALSPGVRAIHLQRYPSICSVSDWRHPQTQEHKTPCKRAEHFCCLVVLDCSQSQHVRVFSWDSNPAEWNKWKGESSPRSGARRARSSPPPLLSERGALWQHWNLCAMTGKRWQHFAPKHEIISLLLHLCHCILARSQWQGLWVLAGFILWALVLQHSVTSN